MKWGGRRLNNRASDNCDHREDLKEKEEMEEKDEEGDAAHHENNLINRHQSIKNDTHPKACIEAYFTSHVSRHTNKLTHHESFNTCHTTQDRMGQGRKKNRRRGDRRR